MIFFVKKCTSIRILSLIHIFCLVLMFLEDKEAEEQFVLSELTEYVQSQYEKEQIDWTIYRYRRHMIKVMKYCVALSLIHIWYDN